MYKTLHNNTATPLARMELHCDRDMGRVAKPTQGQSKNIHIMSGVLRYRNPVLKYQNDPFLQDNYGLEVVQSWVNVRPQIRRSPNRNLIG